MAICGADQRIRTLDANLSKRPAGDFATCKQKARERLTEVAEGEDPSAERHDARAGMTVSEVCDWYLEEAEAGRILGPKRRPIKGSTLHMDRSRIETHIKPLLGSRIVSGLSLSDIEGIQPNIAAGKSARARKGRGGRTTGGAGVVGRTVGEESLCAGSAAIHPDPVAGRTDQRAYPQADPIGPEVRVAHFQVWLRVGKTLVTHAVCNPDAAIPSAARSPAPLAPTITTS